MNYLQPNIDKSINLKDNIYNFRYKLEYSMNNTLSIQVQVPFVIAYMDKLSWKQLYKMSGGVNK